MDNKEWLEVAYQNFQQAIQEGNYSLTKDIIADVYDKGFEIEAQALQEMLGATPLSAFAIVSYY